MVFVVVSFVMLVLLHQYLQCCQHLRTYWQYQMKQTRIVSLGNSFAFMLQIICSICSVSLILESVLLVKGAQVFSMNLEKFPSAVLHPVVNSLIGFPSLCVLYNVELFPSWACLLYSCAMLLLFLPFFHLWAHSLTF